MDEIDGKRLRLFLYHGIMAHPLLDYQLVSTVQLEIICNRLPRLNG